MNKPTVEEMRAAFERVIPTLKGLTYTPLAAMEVNGQFHKYMDPDTDTLWIGFALGYRVATKELLAP